LMKLNQRCYFYYGAEFLPSGRIFGPFWPKFYWKKCWQHWALSAGWDLHSNTGSQVTCFRMVKPALQFLGK
jgi:hypothetical protein